LNRTERTSRTFWNFVREFSSCQATPRYVHGHSGFRERVLAIRRGLVAFVNNIVAGASIALLVHWLNGSRRISVAVVLGMAGTVILTAAFLAYQRWRFTKLF